MFVVCYSQLKFQNKSKFPTEIKKEIIPKNLKIRKDLYFFTVSIHSELKVILNQFLLTL